MTEFKTMEEVRDRIYDLWDEKKRFPHVEEIQEACEKELIRIFETVADEAPELMSEELWESYWGFYPDSFYKHKFKSEKEIFVFLKNEADNNPLNLTPSDWSRLYGYIKRACRGKVDILQ